MGKPDTKAFIVSRRLTLREALPIADPLSPGYLVPREFIGFFRAGLSPEEVLSMVIERAERQIINAVYQEERCSLREERKRPWSRKTRRPFRGRMDKENPTFLERLRLAEEVAREVTAKVGPPWRRAWTGRPPVYDPVKLGAALLVKEDASFNDLAVELRNIGYDATKGGAGATPCASRLHYAFSKISPGWLREALSCLDMRSAAALEKFGERLGLFVLDGSCLTGERMTERVFALKRRLVRQVYPYTALVRLPTNTVRGMARHTNRLKPFTPLLMRGDLLLADPEFDVEENYCLAGQMGIELQVKQKSYEGGGRRSFRKRARRGFDRRKYGMRKLGERFFANVEVRRYRCHYRKGEHQYKGALLMGCEHNIRAYFRNKAWSELFKVFVPEMPPNLYPVALG